MMNMNFADILQAIQDVRAQIDTLGITTRELWIAGGIALVLFILSLREVLAWYLRISQVRGEVRDLRAQMLTMQATLNETRNLLLAQNTESEEPKDEGAKRKTAPKSEAASRFRFDH
jgi:hypothetical protein